MPLLILHTLLIWLTLIPAPAEKTAEATDWKLVKNEQNIRVYTADMESSSFKKIKVEAVVEGKWENIVPAFQDISNYDAWVFATERAHLIRKTNGRRVLYYIETDLPWPAKNRDTAIRMRISTSEDGTIRIDTEARPNAVATTDGHVRVEHFNGKWIFRKAGKGKIGITYYLDLDPGGNLPPWIVNMFVAKGPFETISKLSEILQQ